MNIERAGDTEFVIRLDRSELRLVSHALNEVINGIEVWEFSTRLGSRREEAIILLGQISAMLAESRP
jgi:hypothetical protein